MRNFIIGLVLGAVLGLAATASAAVLVGRTGYLMGWDVTSQGGGTICSDPFVWVATKEIECD